MIEIKEKTDCCGCFACVQICPVNAIAMQADSQGFLYPEVNTSVCINCGKCNKTCPIESYQAEVENSQTAYLLQHKNYEILEDSTSGGAFTAIAQIILKKNGVIFGAAYDDSFSVRHTFVNKVEDLRIFRNSKYVQSTIGDSYKKVKAFLEKERLVCFSGTPCQIEGLLNYIGKYRNSPYLFTVDVVCHAVPSPAVWKAYIEMIRGDRTSRISTLRFRDKTKYGYLYSQFAIQREDGDVVYEGIEINKMLRAFFSEICNRPSCYNCKFKKRYRLSDVTIWDCFDLAEFTTTKTLEHNLGVSRVLTHSDKGMYLMEQASEYCLIEKITVENALHYDAKEMLHSVEKPSNYDKFWSDFYKNPKETLECYFTITWKNKMEHRIRMISFQTGVYSLVRKIYKTLFGNRKR